MEEDASQVAAIVDGYGDLGEALADVRSWPDGARADIAEDLVRQRWPDDLYPQRGMQHAVACSTASIVFLGGAASSGKTWYVLWHPTQFLGVKNYNCTYVRRDKEEVRAPGGLWDEGSLMWGAFAAPSGEPLVHCRRQELEAVYPRRRPSWRAKMIQLHIETPAALEKKKGLQTCDLVIEEATGFMEESFVYLLSRNRPMGGCKKSPQTFLTCNPDRDSWVFNYVRPWVDPTHKLHGVAVAEHLHIRRWESDELPAEIEAHLLERDGAICWVTPDCPSAKSVTYIEGSVYQNRVLLGTDGGKQNLANLEGQDHVQRERLLHSNWLIRDTESHTFQRSWFDVVTVEPKCSRVVRSWDYSVRRKYSRSRTKPDFTVGVKVGLLARRKGDKGRPHYVILDMWRRRCTPSESEDATRDVAELDGKGVHLIQQTTHGDEGIRAVNMTRRYVVPGYTVHGVKIRGDKEDRAFDFSAAAQQGRVSVLKARWNNDFLQECANFPNGRFDDQVDAVSVAISHLRGGAPSDVKVATPRKYAGVEGY